MDIERLSRFGSAMKERAIATWKLAVIQSKPLLHWLQLRPKVVFWAGGLGIALTFLIFSGATAAAAGLLAWSALRQASTASDRHQEQTNADRRRRITETYSKAVSQLASDKLEERLGGIYTLENISKESLDDYWTVMETLTAFVRERSQRNYAEFKKSDERISQVAQAVRRLEGRPEGKNDENWAKAIQLGELPATDIDAVLTVIKRRVEQNRQNWEREGTKGWCFDLRQAVLKKADLSDIHLQGANLWDAHLQGAFLGGAHLEGARLGDAHLEGADLRQVSGLSEDQLHYAHGDAATRLSGDVKRPAHWPPESRPRKLV
jgi:Pentapeptide repeats (8 copies)